MREHRHLCSREGLGSLSEFIDSLYQRLDGTVRVVASDVVVELLPEPLDDVRLRRVGRQEVEHGSRTVALVLTRCLKHDKPSGLR
jgi:hypothetical protein